MKSKPAAPPWADDLRAVNGAFAALEQQLRGELALALQTREHAVKLAEQHLVASQDLELRLQTVHAERLKLEAELAQANSQLALSGQTLSEARAQARDQLALLTGELAATKTESETLAEQARQDRALLREDVQRLHQALAEQGAEHAATLAEQHLAHSQDLELRLQAALAERLKLEAALAQASSQLALSGQTLSDARSQARDQLAQLNSELAATKTEAETLAERTRQERALLGAEVQRLHQALANQGAEHAASVERLLQAAAQAADISANAARQAQGEFESRIVQLNQALGASRTEREQIQRQLQDETQRFRSGLVALGQTIDAQTAAIKEAERAHQQHALLIAQALAERDQHQSSLESRLAAAADSSADLHSRWSSAVQAANDSAAQHAAQVLKLQESADRERHQLLDRLVQADLRAQNRAQAEQAAALARQATLTATHDRQKAALVSQIRTLREALDSRVAALESRLHEAARRFEALQRDALATRQALAATKADHEAALQALALTHRAERRKWLREQAGAQAAVVESLQSKFELDARTQDTLRAEVLALQARLLAMASQTSDPSPASPPGWIDVDAIQAEVQSLRQSLAAEHQRFLGLAALLEAPAPQAPAGEGSPVIVTLAPPYAVEPLPASWVIALPPPQLADPTPPTPRHQPLLQPLHEIATMNSDRTLDELLALYDEEFVSAAYLTYLQRPADAAGFQTHVNNLRGGLAKESMLLAFAVSAEARQCHGTHPHTELLHERARMRRGNLVARLFRRLLGLNPSTLFSRVDAVENRLGKAMNDLALAVRSGDARFGEIRTGLDGLAHALTAERQHQAQQLRTLSGQFAEAAAQIAARVSLIDQRVEHLQAAVSLAAQTAESTLAQVQQGQALTREEARLTRAVASSAWPALDLQAQTASTGNGGSPVDRVALARVREMLLAREGAS